MGLFYDELAHSSLSRKAFHDQGRVALQGLGMLGERTMGVDDNRSPATAEREESLVRANFSLSTFLRGIDVVDESKP
jgi:hypothetical protein